MALITGTTPGSTLANRHAIRSRRAKVATLAGLLCDEIDFGLGMVRLNGAPWLQVDERVGTEDVARDARILSDYLGSFRSFFGNAAGAVEIYWAFLVWLYSAPAAPHLRQAAVPVGIDPWVYPVYAVLYGRSSGGKTLLTRIAARSMFGFEKMIRSGQFTANRALGLRERLGAIPLLIDDVTRGKFTGRVPDLVRTDHETGGNRPIGPHHQSRRQHDPARPHQTHGHLSHRCAIPETVQSPSGSHAARRRKSEPHCTAPTCSA